MASSDEAELHRRLSDVAGTDCSWLPLGTIPDQDQALREDVHKVRSHPLVPDRVDVGGFLYDVDTGTLHQVA